MDDTIFALSSGALPAAIGVIRVSGPSAGATLRTLAGTMPPPRHASLRTLRDRDGHILDSALVLWLPGPDTATGEDLAELHCHGGRAVVSAIETTLASFPMLRRAAPGEFTRRAFANGRVDLAEVEGLADLLSAETELQRRNALSLAGGVLSRQVDAWRDTLLQLSAQIEAALDFDDDDIVTSLPADWRLAILGLATELAAWLATPHAELLRDGLRVVLAGPPNAGKSSLFNALVGADAAIIAPVAGTTRDVLTRPVAIAGVPFVFVDTAGLREQSDDVIEQIGITRARGELASSDIVLWLGAEGEGPAQCWEVEARCDDPAHTCKDRPRHRVSAVTHEGLSNLIADLCDASMMFRPKPGEVALNHRQRDHLGAAHCALAAIRTRGDLLLAAEHLRQARLAFDLLLGRTGVEDMLDTLFARFCIGK